MLMHDLNCIVLWPVDPIPSCVYLSVLDNGRELSCSPYLGCTRPMFNFVLMSVISSTC